MNAQDKRTAASIVMRPRITLHRDLNPVVYQALLDLPDALRNEFLVQIIKDWSRGIVTPLPTAMPSATASVEPVNRTTTANLNEQGSDNHPHESGSPLTGWLNRASSLVKGRQYRDAGE